MRHPLPLRIEPCLVCGTPASTHDDDLAILEDGHVMPVHTRCALLVEAKPISIRSRSTGQVRLPGDPKPGLN